VSAGPASPVDTIVAAATAAGPGQRAIVRLSGEGCRALVCRVLDGWPPLRSEPPASPDRGLEEERGVVAPAPAPESESESESESEGVPELELPPAGRAGQASLDLGGGARLPLELLAWRAPRSATGEDVVELHLPAWPPVVAELLRRCVQAGARPAARGEFTRRAVATGRLDLTQAQAVLDLSNAVNVEQLSAAAAALTGRGARMGRRLREALLDLLSQLEAHVDFEDEDAEAVDADTLRVGIAAAAELAGDLADDAARVPPRDGETDVVLLGPPNAGKSSLVMALAPGARLATSPMAGTTRDALEVALTRGGRRWRLLDGPGIDAGAEPGAGSGPESIQDTDAGASDEHGAELDQGQGQELDQGLERQAMELFLSQLPEGALVLHVRDASAAPNDPGSARRARAAGSRSALTVLTKLDLLPAELRRRLPGEPAPAAPRAGSDADLAPAAQRLEAELEPALEAELEPAPAGPAPAPAPAWAVCSHTGEGIDALWAAMAAATPVVPMPAAASRGEAQAARQVQSALKAALDGARSAELPLLALALREALDLLEREAEQPLQVTQEVLARIFSRFCIGK